MYPLERGPAAGVLPDAHGLELLLGHQWTRSARQLVGEAGQLGGHGGPAHRGVQLGRRGGGACLTSSVC